MFHRLFDRPVNVLFALCSCVLLIVGIFAFFLFFGKGFSGKTLSSAPSTLPFLDWTEGKVSLSPAPPVPPQVRFLFGGDMMFDRNIRQRINERGTDFIFAPIEPLLARQDVVIANLEGPITENPSRSLGSEVGSTSNFIFTFDPKIVAMLKKYHFTVLNLGNNHIGNFGQQGALSSQQFLEAGGLQYFGDIGIAQNTRRSLIVESNGVTIGFVNYNEFVVDGYAHAFQDILDLKKRADVVIVYTHWGLEYQPIANEVIQKLGHTFVDAGADLVIGSHPHVVQQKEVYKGKTIYYSLGNFVFDQYFQTEVQQGLLVEALYDAETKEFTFHDHRIQILRTGQVQEIEEAANLPKQF